MPSFFERLKTRRLASTFAVLASLSAAILAGSYAAHGVHGQEKQSDSTDATPLKIPASSVAPNAFAQIAKQVGPAVVNINTRILPKDAAKSKRLNPHGGRAIPVPQQPDEDDQGDGQDQAPGQGPGGAEDEVVVAATVVVVDVVVVAGAAVVVGAAVVAGAAVVVVG